MLQRKRLATGTDRKSDWKKTPREFLMLSAFPGQSDKITPYIMADKRERERERKKEREQERKKEREREREFWPKL